MNRVYGRRGYAMQHSIDNCIIRELEEEENNVALLWGVAVEIVIRKKNYSIARLFLFLETQNLSLPLATAIE